jgi:hypothetical protein
MHGAATCTSPHQVVGEGAVDVVLVDQWFGNVDAQ